MLGFDLAARQLGLGGEIILDFADPLQPEIEVADDFGEILGLFEPLVDAIALLVEDRSGVDALVDFVHREAGFPDAVVDGPDHAGRTLEAWQDLAVDVEHAVLGDAKDLRGDVGIPE